MKRIITRTNGSRRVMTINEEPSMTDTSFQDECDINTIYQKWMKTGQVTHLARFRGDYADVSEIPDLSGALTTINRANEAFMLLPAEIRKRFGNDPVEMVKFLSDTKNDQEAVSLGLKEFPKQPEIPTVRILDEQTAPDQNDQGGNKRKRVSEKPTDDK